MEYGVRRYEAAQRLLWFLVFLICLALAYYFKGLESYQRSYPVPTVSKMKSMNFWLELQGIQVQHPVPESAKSQTAGGNDLKSGIQGAPRILAGIMIYLILVAGFFVGIRAAWLLIQFLGKYLVQILLHANVKRPARKPTVPLESFAIGSERFFPVDRLAKEVKRFPLPLIFHAFNRLKLMLSNPQATISSEELTEKERRIAETDWQILHHSWQPFNWIVWTLPVLALVQTSSLFYIEMIPILSGKRELADVSGPLLTGLVPVIQVVAIAVSLKVASALLKRLDDLYLSSVDALLYDQFLSRLPFQSGDTLILLQAMQKHFQEMQAALRRLERSYSSRSSSGEKDQEGSES